jgi:transmembrane sensor
MCLEITTYMEKERTFYLLNRYVHDTITELELNELMEYLLKDGNSGSLQEAMEGIIDESPALSDYKEAAWEPLFHKICLEKDKRMGEAPARRSGARAVVRMFNWNRGNAGTRSNTRTMWKVAAAILLICTSMAWYFYNSNAKHKALARNEAELQKPKDDIGPGGNKAVLTLADGSSIDLDGARNGQVGEQGGSKLVKANGGLLAYQHETGNNSGAIHHGDPGNLNSADIHSTQIQYNRLTTPKGGQYQLILPDGTKVWLNAASSIRYPIAFAGKEREVELSGEAYFEVAQNAAMPFRVHIPLPSGQPGRMDRRDGMDVEVLGTHFDVMAYGDEQHINTTLLEGSVKLSLSAPVAGGRAVMLSPGEKATLNGAGAFNVAPADVEEAVAWKNGLFHFSEATIGQVMRQLSRWYDVEVIYVGDAPKDLFRGEIYRNVNVSKVLKVLEASGAHFTVAGKKIFVHS